MKNLFLVLLFPLQTFAHGENMPGPHQGHIRMPGAFHTELVIDESKQDLLVYLVDMENKNPTIRDSSVKLWHQQGKKRTDYSCTAMEDHFHCQSSVKPSLKTGSITIEAVREKAKGNEAVYALPLKPWKRGGHSHHH